MHYILLMNSFLWLMIFAIFYANCTFIHFIVFFLEHHKFLLPDVVFFPFWQILWKFEKSIFSTFAFFIPMTRKSLLTAWYSAHTHMQFFFAYIYVLYACYPRSKRIPSDYAREEEKKGRGAHEGALSLPILSRYGSKPEFHHLVICLSPGSSFTYREKSQYFQQSLF